jgi:hypothetical protein
MRFSIRKLEKFLSSKGFVIKKFFTLNKLCVYLEVINIKNARVFLLYIPSKYQIKITSSVDVYNTKYIDIKNNGNIPSDYAGDPDDYQIANNYYQVDINSEHKGSNNMEKFLESDYNHPISLQSFKKKDIKKIKEIFRQLRRLRFCIKNTKYKLGIMYKSYLCYITRNNEYDCLLINNKEKNNKLRLYVCLDLETFYEKNESIKSDLHIIYDGVYEILKNNQIKNTKEIINIIKDSETIKTYSNEILHKILEYSNFLSDLDSMLLKTNINEKDIYDKIVDIKNQYKSTNNLNKDIEKSHQLAKYNNELFNIHRVKEDIINNILKITEKRSNISLKTDNIFFDNIIMLDAIIDNFNILSQYNKDEQ